MPASSLRALLAAAVSVALWTGFGPAARAEDGGTAPEKPKAEEGAGGEAQPDVAPGKEAAKTDGDKAEGAAEKPSKRIWASSLLFCDAPKIEVGRWLTEKPEWEGKFLLIEFWRTWCGACKRTVPLLNSFHEKYGKELVIVAITGEPEETVKAYNGPAMKYCMALDAPETKDEGEEGKIKDQGATEESFGVWGWPHVVLLEPEHRCVVWEGFPLLQGYELTAKKIERALAIGRKEKAKE
jgi:cytochrome c biogenesis protein CcmG, thiol:disulfide interchange protein DsbE